MGPPVPAPAADNLMLYGDVVKNEKGQVADVVLR